MSRSGYNEDCDYGWGWVMWRGAVASSIRGKRGQAFLREALAALDALPEKRLISNDLQAEGSYCTLGAVGKARGIDMTGIDPYDRETVAQTFGVAGALAAEIMWLNDDEYYWGGETPEDRWTRVRKWIVSQIIPEGA